VLEVLLAASRAPLGSLLSTAKTTQCLPSIPRCMLTLGHCDKLSLRRDIFLYVSNRPIRQCAVPQWVFLAAGWWAGPHAHRRSTLLIGHGHRAPCVNLAPRLLVTICLYCSVSGFATSVVKCGTTRVPMGLPMYLTHTQRHTEPDSCSHSLSVQHTIEAVLHCITCDGWEITALCYVFLRETEPRLKGLTCPCA
jgi:hypothetical protein